MTNVLSPVKYLVHLIIFNPLKASAEANINMSLIYYFNGNQMGDLPCIYNLNYQVHELACTYTVISKKWPRYLGCTRSYKYTLMSLEAESPHFG